MTMTASLRRLIIRADDAGSARSANRAIRAAVRARAVGAVGFMAPGADAADMRRFWNATIEPGEIARARAAETAVLCGATFRERLLTAGVALIRFSDLTGG